MRLLMDVLRISWRYNPAVHALLIDGDTRRREARIGECPYGNGEVRIQPAQLVVDRSTAMGAKVEPDLRAFIPDPHILGRGACKHYLLATESGLLAKDAARPALAGQAVADGDAHRFADDLGRELTATA
ncbi:hypothetical protein GCM10007907_31490 [Chitinimonas prasina]|uniref:Uncharacterized protein n=1 Tax=Chitinimonas prasina TaxID=1434937 RepID=A0ABQ5YK71_9NEIS|nr:hypothetical protein GCM10007907_31490 [Chitinimonas prasina]